MITKLLILDLDETLIFGTTKSLDRKPDFDIGEYVIYKRSHLDNFLEFCLKHFDVAIWTSATKSYAHAIVAQLFSDNPPLKFVWARDRCIQRYNPQQHKNDYIKDLRKAKKQGYQLEHMIAVDDSPEKHVKNYGNLVQVSPFEGEQEDNELLYLMNYLLDLKQVENIRLVEKRNWQSRYISQSHGKA